MPTAREYLSDPGLGLVREVRESQLQMASSVEEVIQDGGVLFVEGPVGCGKTYAYLVPSLLAAGKRVVIATAKKQLQDQINVKDLPSIAKTIGSDMQRLLVSKEGNRQLLSVVIKGKGNYACRLLAEKTLEKHPNSQYLQFLARSQYGDRADYQGAPPPWWASATAEECIGRGCKHSQVCGYLRLRSELSQARVAVVNHHVLGADMYYGFGKMTGGPYDVLIVDEAHKLAEGIRAAFTVRVTETAIADIEELLGKTFSTFSAPKRVAAIWEAMFHSLPNRHWRDAHLREVPVFPQHAPEAIQGLEEIDAEVSKTLAHYGVKGSPSDPGFWEALSTLAVDEEVRKDLLLMAQTRKKIDGLVRGIRTMQGTIKPLEEEEPEDFEERKARILENTVAYGQQDRRGKFLINCAPVNLGGIAKNYFASVPSTIITSATLAVDGHFDHLNDIVGVKPTKAEVLPSTFDYDAQGFVYIPKDLPHVARTDPKHQEVTQKRIDRAIRLIELSQGGAFILTTANDDLDAFAIALKQKFPGRVFAQGHAKTQWDGDPPAVLERYLATPNAVLVGSKSFWEGVDVPGERLRLVILTKLPFPMFGDPIIKARERQAGDAAFKRVQLVDMLIDLRQGVGRLIRSRADRGCVAILDSRVWEKRSYGGAVVRALPWSANMVTSEFAWCEKYLPRFVAYFQKLSQKGSNGQSAQSV